MFFDINDILSHNCMLNIIQCGRGVGKTYSSLKWALKDYIRHRNKFIYLRRYKNELKETMKESPLKTIMHEDAFKEYTTDVRGNNFYCAPTSELMDGEDLKIGKLFNDKYKCGQAIALSTSGEIKSSDFSDYNKLIFEEFSISGQFSHYIRDEVIIFLELLETVFRHRKMKVVMLGNTVTKSNPYFSYFGITNPNANGITKYYLGHGKDRKKDILLYNGSNEDFKAMKRKTDIGRLIDGTSYGRYAIDNESLTGENARNVEKKSERSRFLYSLIYKGKEIGLWIDVNQGKLFASYRIPNEPHRCYSVTREDMTLNSMLINSMRNVNDIKTLKNAVTYNYLYFESEGLFYIMNEIIDLLHLW